MMKSEYFIFDDGRNRPDGGNGRVGVGVTVVPSGPNLKELLFFCVLDVWFGVTVIQVNDISSH